MKKILVIILLTNCTAALSQSIDFVFRDSILNNRSIHVSSLNSFTTNTLNNELLSKFIYGGEITNNILNDNAQKQFNILGGELEQSLNYFEGSFLNKYPNLGLTFSLSDVNFAAASYKPSVFDLAFRGNSPYLGDTLDLSYLRGQYTHYQNYGLGIYDKRTQSYIRLGFLVGNRSLRLQSSETYFHTSETADNMYLETNLFGYYTPSDSNSQYFTGQGYGFALEVNHNFFIQTKSDKKYIINFNLSNLGSIFWSRNTESIRLDTAYNFQGFEYSAINSVPSISQGGVLDTLGIRIRKGVRREALPIQIIINKTPYYSLDQKWQSTFGFKALLIPDYRPMIFGGVYYQPNKYFSLSTRAIIGGFGGLRFGFNANLWLQDHFYLGISTLDIVGTSTNRFGKGKSVNLALQYNF